uniref:DNA (cytosine-5-)-methyltransferase n=1 Tax=Kalanchoe fedtschenkoi TaxID=63787 RepID=A0A7N0U0Y4_KALFE
MADSDESGSIDWNSEDDREIEEACVVASSSRPRTPEFEPSRAMEIPASGSSAFRIKDQFRKMGFPEAMVVKAIEGNEGRSEEEILDTLLTYSAIGNDNEAERQSRNEMEHSKDNTLIYLSGDDRYPEEKPDQDEIVAVLVEMGYSEDEVLVALQRCGAETPIDELADFIGAAQMVKESDALAAVNEFTQWHNVSSTTTYSRQHKSCNHIEKKRKLLVPIPKNDGREEDMDVMHLPNPMIGYGVPGEPYAISYRTLPEAARGPPYFYYENVALAPKGVWAKISRFLYEVQPEFVDSAYFCAANRKRGYIHNLPISNRFALKPLPPRTIHEALPSTKKWWPSWDKRTKFNCLQTCIGSAKLTERIRKELEKSDMEPPSLVVQQRVLDECRRWNLVWVGKNKVAPLEPDEMEFLLGFPRDHTRGVSRTDRYKALGNTFQVDTVAYHLSVLKDVYPEGMNVLSLFSGIGGAEVALHKVGVPLKNVLSIEISEINRRILRSWWEQTDQKGTLVELDDVQRVTNDILDKWARNFGGFDLIIGGSPCNNLSGSNRVSRDGLEGAHSSLFFDYFRILDHVRSTGGIYQ